MPDPTDTGYAFPGLIPIPEVCRRTGLGQGAVRRAVASGQLPAFRLVGKQILVDERDLHLLVQPLVSRVLPTRADAPPTRVGTIGSADDAFRVDPRLVREAAADLDAILARHARAAE